MIHSCVCEVDGRKSNRILLLLVEWKAFSLSRNSTMLRFSGGVVSAPSVLGNLNRKVEMKIKQKKPTEPEVEIDSGNKQDAAVQKK